MSLISVIGCADGPALGVDRPDADRPEAGAGVLDRQPARLHVHGAWARGSASVAQLAVVAAMFHLFTHAFFKALLFLASGSVMHAMGGVIDMRRFRGLRHRLPVHLLDVRRRRPGAVGHLPVRRLLEQGRDPDRPEVGRRTASGRTDWGRLLGDLLGRRADRLHDRLLHRPGLLPDLLRPREAARAPTTPRPRTRPRPITPGALATHGSSHDDPGHGHRDHGHGHDAHFGHESPPIMTYPADHPGRLRGLCRASSSAPYRAVRAPPRANARLRSAWATSTHAHGSDWPTAAVGTPGRRPRPRR